MRLVALLAAPLSVLVFHVAAAAAPAGGIVAPEAPAGGIVAPAGGIVAPGRLERWVRSGLQWLQRDQLDRCLRRSSLSGAACRRLGLLPPAGVAVYASEPPPHGTAGNGGRGGGAKAPRGRSAGESLI